MVLGSSALSMAQSGTQGAVEQREQIRKAVLTEHNEIEFRLATTKAAKDFCA
jgi:hypothetical protein